MDANRISPNRPVTATALACGLSLAAASSALGQASGPDASVAVFADHFVFENAAIDDLDVLEHEVDAKRPRSVRLEGCSAGADRPLRAAAHRFRRGYLEMRIAEANAPVCRPAALLHPVAASQRSGPRPFGIRDEAVDRWWHTLMP
ncbi:MAG TPA: hypothetical protein PK787_02295 [Burkholderiaceae bacterium]|jgi:hypothetical protein|nr:hypothetical protein [Burkholderiaceae bacterium]